MKRDRFQPTVSAAPESSEAAQLGRDLFHPRSPWRPPHREAACQWLGMPRRGKRLARWEKPPGWAGNLVGVALAERRTSGRHCGEAAITLLVRRKLPKAKLGRGERLPKQMGGYPTDVVEVGTPHFAQGPPVQAGMALGVPGVSPGTLGAYLRDADGLRYAITNGHVAYAPPGTPVFSPAYGVPGAQQIGVVRWVFPPMPGQMTDVDLGVVEIDPAQVIDPSLPWIGSPAGWVMPDPQQPVRMVGATSGPVGGWLHSAHTYLSIPIGSASYGFKAVYFFSKRGAGVFGRPGDSGALIVDDNSLAVIAQLFAVGVDYAYGIPFGKVAAKLDGFSFLQNKFPD